MSTKSTDPSTPPDVPDRTQVQTDAHQTREFSADATNSAGGTVAPGAGVPGYPFLSPPQLSDEIGRLGDYRILKKLGEGGMGFVFRGHDPALNRDVALKVMRPEVASKPQAADRFLREGRAAAGLKSDHIITIYQVGQANGVPFLAMEFLEGLPLDEWIKGQKKAVPLPHALRIVKDTLRGLAAAHDKGLIHRDIKPANLWIEKGTARVKVLDFGLTRSNDADVQLTQEGAVVGTPAYMAPEQASGKPVDPRADLFSVGVVLYTLLAGQNPFARGSLMETLGAVGFETQPPVTTVRPDVPPAYSAFLDRLLAKKPDGRPANAKAALQELVAIDKKLADTAKAVASSGSVPVVAIPAPAAAPPVWNELTENDTGPVRPGNTESTRPLHPAAADAPRKPPASKKKLLIGGGLFAFLLAVGGILIVITNKDGTKTKVEVPDGATVDVQKDGTSVATVGPKKADVPKAAAADADRKTAEVVIARHGNVDIVSVGIVGEVARLPAGPFKVVGIRDSDGSVFTDADLDAVRELTDLKVIIVRGTVTDAGVGKLATGPCAAGLEVLILDTPNLTDAAVAAAAKFPRLNTLRLDRSPKITGKGLHLLPKATITALGFLGGGVADAELAPLKDMPKLASLDLAGTPVTDAGLARVAEVPALNVLNVAGCAKLTDAGMTHLTKVKWLGDLSLSGVPLTPAGWASVAVMPNLRRVFAQDGPAFTDDAAAAVAKSATLESLVAPNTPLTDAGLKALAGVKTLKYLDATATKVTADGAKAFRAARPDVDFRSDFAASVADPDRVAAEKLLPFFDLTIVPAGKTEEVKLKVGTMPPAGAFAVTGLRVWTTEKLPQSFADDVLLPAIKPLTRLTVIEDASSKINMTGTDPAKWGDLASREALTKFQLGVPLSNTWVDVYRQYPKLKSIQITNGNSVPAATLKRLADLPSIIMLRVSNLVGAERWDAVTALPLATLTLSNPRDLDMAAADRVAAMSTLVEFNLNEAAPSAGVLASFGKSQSLRYLSFSRSELPKTELDKLGPLPRLQLLTIGQKSFDDSQLLQLAGLSTLTYLTVRETAVTEAGAKALAVRLPKCTIEWSGGKVKHNR